MQSHSPADLYTYSREHAQKQIKHISGLRSFVRRSSAILPYMYGKQGALDRAKLQGELWNFH